MIEKIKLHMKDFIKLDQIKSDKKHRMNIRNNRIFKSTKLKNLLKMLLIPIKFTIERNQLEMHYMNYIKIISEIRKKQYINGNRNKRKKLILYLKLKKVIN
jgi:hypothetical protein